MEVAKAHSKQRSASKRSGRVVEGGIRNEAIVDSSESLLGQPAAAK